MSGFSQTPALRPASVGRRRQRAEEPPLRRALVPQPSDACLRVLEQFQHRPSVRDDDAPRGGDGDGARAASAHDERHADGRLELRDLMADRRARVAEPPRGGDEAPSSTTVTSASSDRSWTPSHRARSSGRSPRSSSSGDRKGFARAASARSRAIWAAYSVRHRKSSMSCAPPTHVNRRGRRVRCSLDDQRCRMFGAC